MKYHNIINKINKYNIKFKKCNNEYARALYQEKITYYNNLNNYQMGGGGEGEKPKEGLEGIIGESNIKIKEDVTKLMGEITDILNRTSKIDTNAVVNLTEGISTLKDSFGKVKKQIMGSTVEFAKYNITVRDSFDKLRKLLQQIKPLDNNQIQIILNIVKQMEDLNLGSIDWNQELIGEMGVLIGDQKESSIKLTMERLFKILEQKDKEMYEPVKEFFNNNVIKSMSEKSNKYNYSKETMDRYSELEKKFK